MKGEATLNDCVFHSDQYVFDLLTRDVRKAGLIPRALAKVMAMAVCTCRKKVSHRSYVSQEQVQEAAHHVTNHTSDDALRPLSAMARELVTSAAHVAMTARPPRGDGGVAMTSQGRLTVVISQALRSGGGDAAATMTLLTEERVSTLSGRNDKAASAKDVKKPAGKTRVPSGAILRKMTKKRKEKSLIKAALIVLPVFGGSTRALFNNALVGPRFSSLCAKHACVIELDSEKTAVEIAANAARTHVRAWCASQEVLNDVKTVLTSLSLEIQRESRRKWEIRRAWAKQERDIRLAIKIEDEEASKKIADFKEALSDDFDKKEKNKNRTRRWRRDKAAVKREDGSTFSEGHCLFCLLPLKHFKGAQLRDDTLKECRHHPGYVIGKRWTCCQSVCDSADRLTNEEHSLNGCTVTHHCWRPHRKAARGVGEKAYRYERDVRQRRITLAPHTFRPLIY